MDKQLELYKKNFSGLVWHQRSKQARLWILDMISAANSSHFGCSLSIVDLLVVIYSMFDLEPIQQKQYPRDIFILSKGHAAAALYAVHATVGLIPESALKTFYKDNSVLAGHPIRHSFAGVEASTGSLGHGASLGVGHALALRHDGHTNTVIVLVGDGECQEGSVWEALDMVTRFKLDNFILVVDYNNLQGLDTTEDISGKELHKKLEAFGCAVSEVDGHDHAQIFQAIQNAKIGSGKPHAVIAYTTKGKGIPFMENKLEWHYKCPKGDIYEAAKKTLSEL